MFKEHRVAKKSQKNSKHVADLVNSSTLTSISLLAQVDKFGFCCNKGDGTTKPLLRL